MSANDEIMTTHPVSGVRGARLDSAATLALDLASVGRPLQTGGGERTPSVNGVAAPRLYLGRPDESLRDRLVLVANDDETQRFVQTALEPRQVRVVCTADDEQTIAAALRESPDLVVARLGSSPTEGLAVAQRLRKNAATAAIPLLAITRHPSVDLQERAESAGFDAVLIEPLTRTTFADVAGLLIERAALLRRRSDRLRRSDGDGAPRTPEAHRRTRRGSG